MDIFTLEEDREPLDYVDLEILLSELDHYRSRSQRLEQLNDLYARLAGITDMPTMIESFSIWLAKHAPHEIIGYINLTRGCKHLYCSCHGPQRRQVISLADSLLLTDDRPELDHQEIDGLHCHSWNFSGSDGNGRLILLRRDGKIPADQVELIDQCLEILADPLARTHDFEEICRQARKDALTGLANRLVFEERIEEIVERSRRHGLPLTLVALDLDRFKMVNDTRGHLYGDEVLKLVAAVLGNNIRLSDLLVRMGGDEFLLVLPDTDLGEARRLCERLCSLVHDLGIRAGSSVLGISIGLARWEPGLDRNSWLEKADNALYQAKRGGRNQVVH